MPTDYDNLDKEKVQFTFFIKVSKFIKYNEITNFTYHELVHPCKYFIFISFKSNEFCNKQILHHVSY